MKSRMKVASVFVLFAMVLSLVPAAVTPSPASASSASQACSDWAQFVADVTVPDGTKFSPGATFKKTWRLKNIGTCTWTTSYSLVFDTGTQMTSTSSVAFTTSVPPGGTIDVSVDMTAPSAAGHYIGYWKFKNAAGTLFGIGSSANKSWWVEINVTGSTTTGVAYDFSAQAETATWASGAGGLTFPGTDGDAKGFALRVINAKFESGATSTQPALLVGPQQITNGFIEGRYPAFAVQSGDRFQATVGCAEGSTSCYVAYRLDYKVGSTIRTFWSFRERYEGWTYNANLDLSPLAGQNVEFILHVDAYGSPTGDRSLWGNPVIVRKGATTPPTATGTPPTATPSRTPGPVTVPPSTCDKAQFIADVTVPDGTVMSPGQTFTKTWRLKNIGTCAWSTSYQLVFSSGEQMGAPASAAFTTNVAVGQTADFSVNMTAPSAAGSYRGYWMFKNASGQLFGIGSQANKPWWVDIKVSGPTVTPGGPTRTPTATPTGPTPTQAASVAYDFAANACAATWHSGAGTLPCPGSDGDAKGFVLKVTSPRLETGTTDSRTGLVTYPQNVQDGYIQGIYPAFRVQSGDRFKATINCEYGATYCYVGFRLDYQTGSDPIRTYWGPFRERYEGQYYTVDVDVSSLAGKDVKFILTVLALGTPYGDRALWVGPYIYRPSGATPPATSAPSTATATSTTPAGATATTSAATATSTPTPTSTTAAAATATSTPTPTATATATATSGSAGSTYQNARYNFKFTLPMGAVIVSQTDNIGRVALPIIAGGTNLLQKYVQINVVENADPCVSPAVDGVPTSTENVTINNIPFVKTTGQGAAAGNRFDWIAYTTTRNNACISLAFILHSANPGNYATPPPTYEAARESAVINTTVNTYSTITP